MCYRVTTLFGKVLYSQRSQRCDEGLTLAGPDDFRLGGVSIVVSAKGSQVQLNTRRISSNSASSHTQRFPQIPLSGFDIVREVSTGKLFVLEANAIGYVWKFDARIRASYAFSAEAQFNGLRKAAYILAEKTQQAAD